MKVKPLAGKSNKLAKAAKAPKPAPKPEPAKKAPKKVSRSFVCATGVFVPPDRPHEKIPMFYVHPVDKETGEVRTDARIISLSASKAKLLAGFLDEFQAFVAANS